MHASIPTMTCTAAFVPAHKVASYIHLKSFFLPLHFSQQRFACTFYKVRHTPWLQLLELKSFVILLLSLFPNIGTYSTFFSFATKIQKQWLVYLYKCASHHSIHMAPQQFDTSISRKKCIKYVHQTYILKQDQRKIKKTYILKQDQRQIKKPYIMERGSIMV